MAAGRPFRRPTLADRGEFLLEYIELLLHERNDEAQGFRHSAVRLEAAHDAGEPARGRERWVINKLRALCSWYSKGLEDGAHLRVAVNSAANIQQLRDIIHEFFVASERDAALAR